MGFKYKTKKTKLADKESFEKLSKHLLEPSACSSGSDDDDEGPPEEVGFGASKDEALEELKQIQESIQKIKTKQKLKRKKQEERNKKQKEEKLENLQKLPESLLKNLSSSYETKNDEETADESNYWQQIENLKQKQKKKISEPEIDDNFIPLKKQKTKKSLVKVVSLETKLPNAATSGVNFREQMLYSGNINRKSASKLFSNLNKRRLK